MSITDELRTGGIYRFPSNRRVFTEEELTAIADRIDAEHEDALREAYMKGRNDGFDRGFASADDWCAQHEDAMEKHGWVKLPKDIDDKLIHEHDKVDWRNHAGTWHNNALVVAVCSDGCYVMDGMVFHVHASDIRHHKHPTVEDVLAELLCEYDRDDFELTELIERFAAKLQLRGGK